MEKISKKTYFYGILIVVASWVFVTGLSCIDVAFISTQGFNGIRRVASFFGLSALILLIYFVLWAYCVRFRQKIIASPKMLATLFCIISLGYIFNIFVRNLGVFAMPLTFVAMTCVIFFDSRISFTANVFMTVLMLLSSTTQLVNVSFERTVETVAMIVSNFVVGSLIAVMLGKKTSRLNFILVGTLLNLIDIVIIALFSLADVTMILERAEELKFLPLVVFLPVLLSLLFQPVLEFIFNVTSNFRLVELTDPHAPLMKLLQSEAPGTYSHSLTVANLVETCATVMGENVYFARAAAYYHDIGKIQNPMCFSENQTGGENIHDSLSPEASVDIIRKHTVYGESLAKEYRIPQEIAEIARQHHGTTVMQYFFEKAKSMTDGRALDEKNYSYIGSTPTSKIAGLVMICDACEAAIRASDNHDAETVDKLVRMIISGRLRSGQFDNCPLTMKDLNVARVTIVNATCGMYHERVQYPQSTESN